MRAPASAYEALGLEPGADRAAVEQAYRRLIKLHHPDRSGGDAGRAAEINRAYFELRRLHDSDPPIAPREIRRAAPGRSRSVRAADARRRRRRTRIWPLLVLAVGAWVLVDGERLAEPLSAWIGPLGDRPPPVPAAGGAGAVRLDPEVIDGALHEAVIAEAADRAVRLAGPGGEKALVGYSRDCHRRLRLQPELALLDRCAAFDDAVAILADQSALSDRVTFSASAVAARQMTAASLLSNDFLANERRLDRIRARVELILLPRPAPLPPVAVADDEPPAGPEPAPEGP